MATILARVSTQRGETDTHTMSDPLQDQDDTAPIDLEAVANRLEAALDRITRHFSAPPTVATNPPPEIAGRLDTLIAKLHHALGNSSSPTPTE